MSGHMSPIQNVTCVTGGGPANLLSQPAISVLVAAARVVRWLLEEGGGDHRGRVRHNYTSSSSTDIRPPFLFIAAVHQPPMARGQQQQRY